jgi:hypothetical protein
MEQLYDEIIPKLEFSSIRLKQKREKKFGFAAKDVHKANTMKYEDAEDNLEKECLTTPF